LRPAKPQPRSDLLVKYQAIIALAFSAERAAILQNSITEEHRLLPMDLATTKTISHYNLTRKLGSGGMGVVYEAEDSNLGKQDAR
jgi:serine/threonine protein kinase